MTSHEHRTLICKKGVWIDKPEEGKHYKADLDIHVFDENGSIDERYEMMCLAIYEDVQTAKGSGRDFIEAIHSVESGKAKLVEADGNAWVAHITRSHVSFEGLYGQGSGGSVSFAQYKLAVETYVRFLEDPDRKPLEVPFPEGWAASS